MESVTATHSELPGGQMSLARKIVMLASGVPIGLALSTIAPILPKIEAALAQDDNDRMLVKMIVGIVGVSYIVGSPIAGYIADRIGRSRVLAASTLLMCLAGCAGYFLTDLKLLVLSRLLAGIGAAGANTAGYAMIADISDEKMRHRYMGLQVSFATMAAIFSMSSAGFLGDYNWRLPFLIHLIGIPSVILAYLEAQKESVPSRNTIDPAILSAAKKEFPFPYGLMVLGLVAGVFQYISLTYMPFQLRDIGVTTSKTIGMVLTIYTIAVSTAAGSFGKVRTRLSSRAIFAMCFASAGIGGAGVALSHELAPIVFSMLFIGAAIGWFVPNLVTRAAEAAHATTRGSYVGLIKGTNSMSSFLAVIILEPIVRLAGVHGVFVFMAISACLIAVGLAGYNWTRRAVAQPSH